MTKDVQKSPLQRAKNCLFNIKEERNNNFSFIKKKVIRNFAEKKFLTQKDKDMNELFNIKDQVVVITGGTGVLGRCIAKYLAKEGAKVVIMGRKAEIGNEIVADIKAQGGEAMFLVTDVMNKEKVEENLQDILKAYGRVDALLNAAGGNMPGATIAPTGNFFDLDPEQFKRVLELNLTGTVIPTQIFLKPMVEQGKGSIINFSSMAAFRPMTRVCGYAAAKAGISNFTAWLATHFAGTHIRCNAIAPGFLISAQNKALLFNEDGNPTKRSQKILSNTPMNRFVESDELLGATLFLCDDRSASAITGVVLPIDCGFAAYSGV